MAAENALTLYDRGAYEKIEDNAADMHDHLVRALGVRANERWLDIATGTGAVALRAARLGADVTGQDLSSRLIKIAAEKAAAAGLSVRFVVGDCEQLPVRYMYVRADSSTADPADSHVQARTAPQTRRQKHLGAGFTGTGNDGAGTTQPDPPAHSGCSGTQPA